MLFWGLMVFNFIEVINFELYYTICLWFKYQQTKLEKK